MSEMRDGFVAPLPPLPAGVTPEQVQAAQAAVLPVWVRRMAAWLAGE